MTETAKYSRPRLDETVKIPLGAVLTCAVTGLRFVYLGNTVNSKGQIFWFHPEMNTNGVRFMVSLIFCDKAEERFPGIVETYKL